MTTRLRVVVLAVVLGASLVAPVSGAAAEPAGGLTFVDPGRTVTLVTGDRVTVRTPRAPDEPPVSVRPAPGRERVRFSARQERGEWHVVPSDVVAALGNGSLDRMLFNVSRLLEFGYDDRSRADLPLIISYQQGAPRAAATLAGATVVRELPSISGVAIRAAKAAPFWAGVRSAAGVARVLLDGKVRASLDHSVPQIGAPAAWARGHTGAGTTVAVLDTGIDGAHPDLAGAVIAERDFTDSPSGPKDVAGHGTHVAGIITGDGAASGGKYVGVAPDARLLNGKVLGDDGFGQDSELVAGMEWAVGQGADVVNMSLGTRYASDGTDVIEQTLNRLTAESGTLFVVASGNSGPGAGSVGSPGAADAALTVGAVDREDALAYFSSRGPRLGDNAIKPEITAPGVEILSAEAGGGGYVPISGTSMATPHVSGAAAVLASGRPTWGAGELKAALIGSAEPKPDATVYEQGAGRLNLDRATAQNVRATPAVVSNETPPWPHDDDSPVTTKITYHNDGAEPVTLALTLDGGNAPAGMFSLPSGQIEVPAHGSAAVDLTTDTRVPAPIGNYGGMLTATGGTAVVRTPVGVTVESESYDLTLNMIDAAGKPTEAYEATLINADTGDVYRPYHPSGTVRTRLPKGRYFLSASLYNGPDVGTVRVEPELVVDRDRPLDVDARKGVRIGVDVDRPEARTGNFFIGIRKDMPAGTAFQFLFGGTLDGLTFVPSESAVPDEQFRLLLEAHLARPDGAGGFRGSPYLYHAMWTQRGRVPANLVRRFSDRDFGITRSEIASTARDQSASMLEITNSPVPTTLTEYYLPGYLWFTYLWMLTDPAPGAYPDSIQNPLPRTVKRGERRTERWNMGVLGPAFPHSPEAPFVYSFRSGTDMRINVPAYSDQSPNHSGWSAPTTGQTVVLRDGKEIGTSPFMAFGDFPAVEGPASYEVRTEGTQNVEELSTKISATWKFRSQDTGQGEQALPMAAIRFAPDLDQRNRARAGRLFAIPVTVEQQAGATFGRPRGLTVDMSYDDGRTWHRVPVFGRTALVFHPWRASYISLRATASDTAGNEVSQTIIRAYALSSTT